VLPSLVYTCARCQVTISHPDDTDLVTKVATHHNLLVHRTERMSFLGEWTVTWGYVIDPATVDVITERVCAAFGKRGVDVWADQLEVRFTTDGHCPPEDVVVEVARVLGPDLDLSEIV
jgi:hypothetical protein